MTEISFAQETGLRLAEDVRSGNIFALLPYISTAEFVPIVSGLYAAQCEVLERLHEQWRSDVIRYYAREMINESLRQF